MIIDSHVHLGTEEVGFNTTVEMIKEQMQKANIDHSIIFPLSNDETNCFHSDNSVIIKAVKENPKLFTGFMRLNPKCKPEMIKEESKRCHELGLRGIKIHPTAQKFKISDKSVELIFEIAEQYGIPVTCHTHRFDEYSDPEMLIERAKQFPNVKIISCHGEKIFPLAVALKELSNFYTDTSCITNHAHIAFLCSKGDPNKILFGSDFPFSLPQIERLKIDLCNKNLGIPQKEGISENVKNLILGENAKKLLNL